jgi:two-component system, LytTR family, response regulator
VDYLLKPVSRARLARAIDRIRSAKSFDGGAIDRVTRSTSSRAARFLAKHAKRYRVVPDREVLYFLSEEGLTKLVTETAHYLMDPTLTDLESRLDSSVFLRISRATIVNMNAVREVVPLIGGSGEVVLKNGTRLEVSRRRFKELVEKLQT